MRLAWIPEHTKFSGMYATGRRVSGRMIITHTADEALQFAEKGACVEWCNANNPDLHKPAWAPVEHSWMEDRP